MGYRRWGQEASLSIKMFLERLPDGLHHGKTLVASACQAAKGRLAEATRLTLQPPL